jgi:hypothetical protein
MNLTGNEREVWDALMGMGAKVIDSPLVGRRLK